MNYLKPLLLIAGAMLLLAIPPIWPYAYYQLMRIVVCIAGVLGAYIAFKHKRSAWVWVLGVIAVLFNPLAPIHLDKESWVIPDLIAAILMFVASTKLKHRDL
jgi:uncharacterized membrane protein HdeD (DUF308 family)